MSTNNNNPPPLGDKPFWQSKRFWGLLIAFVGAVLPLAGIGDTNSISNLTSAAMNALDAAMQFGGLLIALIGSIKAEQPLAFRFRR